MSSVAIVGSPSALAAHAPASRDDLQVAVMEAGADLDAIAAVDAIVAIDPTPAERERLAAGPLPALIWHAGAATATVGAPHARTVAGAGPGIGGPSPWRTVPLPVADALFAPAGAPAPAGFGRAAWLGPPTDRRALYESHFGDSIAIEPDAGPEDDAAIAVQLADRRDHGHGARVALARGRLLVSEPIVPGHGLEPGIDHLVANDLADVRAHVVEALRNPPAVERVRLLGRRKAELFRSSRVIARLVGDLLAELDAVSAR